MSALTRRQLLYTAGAATVSSMILKSCNSTHPQQPTTTTSGIETTTLHLGFMPNFAAAPLVIAKAKGLLDKYGFKEINLVKQSSWKVMRGNTELGSINGGVDGGQYQMPMPHLLTEGLITTESTRLPMYSLLQLATHGSGIAIASKHAGKGLHLNSSKAKPYISSLKTSGTPFTAAYTYDQCGQELWLRYWLAAGGIHPDRDVRLTLVPPAQSVAQMKTGDIDGVSVGDPWVYRVAGADRIGFMAALTSQIWRYHPGEYFGLRKDWADKHPNATKAILKALIEAQQWLDNRGNRQEAVEILGERKYINLKPEVMLPPMESQYVMADDRPNIQDQKLGPIYWRAEQHSISYPYKSHDLWFLIENMRWGFLPSGTDPQPIINAVNREDLWRAAAQELGIPAAEIPTDTSRGIETFFDGVTFNPANPQAYLKSLKIKSPRA